MSKAEFERLQKEYAEAAIRTAEKARLSYDADEPKEEIPKAENIAAAISRLPTPAEENVNETIKHDSVKIATVQVKITEAESEITASGTEDENKESEEAETNIPVNEEKSDENTDKSDTDDKQQNSSAGAQTMKQATLKSTAISLIIQPIPKFPTKPKITLLTKYCAALKALL